MSLWSALVVSIRSVSSGETAISRSSPGFLQASPLIRLAARPVVAEDLWHAERFVPRPTPYLRTTWRVAYDLDVTSAGPLCSRAVARFPADGHGARLPGMVIPALHREARPDRLFFLLHYDIQT